MQQNIKRIGLINWIALLAAAGGTLLIAHFSGSPSALTAAILAGIGALVALLSYCQMSLEAREQLEKLELEELSKTRGGSSLFAASADDTFPARRSRQQFERFFVPALAIVLLGLECAGTWYAWKYASHAVGLVKDRATLSMALMGLMGLILFLFGKYSSGLARLQKQRLLRPGAAYLLLSAYACLVVTATMAASLAGFAKADLIAARALCVVMGLIAFETLIGLVLEMYRVRVKGKDTRVLYESRLVGLLGEPEAIITTAAHALDYQFGFKVSETWFYRFLEKALAWMLLAQVAILMISTSVVVIDPGQQALLERFGAPVAGRGILNPGLHLKLPWPIDLVYRYKTEQVQGFIVGAEPETARVVQWTKAHAKEDNFLVAYQPGTSPDTNGLADASGQPGSERILPVNLLAVSIPVQYQITNLDQWAYVNSEPTNLLQLLARRVTVRFLAGVDMDDLMSQGRGPAEAALKTAIQTQANDLRLGVNITFVGLEDIHPPQKVAKTYEDVVSEREKSEVRILTADTHAITTNAQASAAATQLLTSADSSRASDITNAAARAILFASQSLAYAAAPGPDGVYEHRAYLDVLSRSTQDAQRKIILATASSSNQIFELNLEEKIPDLGTRLTIPKPN